MKIFLLLSLIFNFSLANRLELDLKPVKNEYYVINQEMGTLAFNVFPNKHIFLISNDISKLNNPLYTSNEEKTFWLLTDGFVEVLKRHKFKNNQYIYFAFYDNINNSIYQNMYLQVEMQKLQQFNNRDFSDNDKKQIQNATSSKYKLLPIRDLLNHLKSLPI